MSKNDKNEKDIQMPTRPSGERPTFVRSRLAHAQIEPASTEKAQLGSAPNPPPPSNNRPSSARPRSSQSLSLDTERINTEAPVYQNQTSSPPAPSPTSVVDTTILGLNTDIQPFFDVLYAKIAHKLIETQGIQQINAQADLEIKEICIAITVAIAEFKKELETDPTTYCRSADNMTLWTQKRHMAIKELQNKIHPHFDRVNQLLMKDSFSTSPSKSSRSAKQLYSSPAGRQKAARHGPILETTPFGKILESTSIHTMLKRCFGPNAFVSNIFATKSQKRYKEIDGTVVELQENTPQDNVAEHSIEFTTDPDTAVVIGVWEAISSSYAQETMDEAHIYVPFGISTNSVAWNHELPELRKNYAEDQIIIHTLADPDAYHALKLEYEQANVDFLHAKKNPDVPSEIKFALKMTISDIQKKMDSYLNDAKNWEQAPINQSKVNIVNRSKTKIPLLTLKSKMHALRSKKSEKTAEKSPAQNQSDAAEDETSSDSIQPD